MGAFWVNNPENTSVGLGAHHVSRKDSDFKAFLDAPFCFYVK
jgi:hypothetical protein